MNYAANSVQVRRISPKPTAAMTLAAATQAGMLSLSGTGSMERVQVDCPVGETWEITVGNSLGVVSAQDDIQGALDHYAAPPVTAVLSELDALESELRNHLPHECLLLSLFASVRREICWLLPNAGNPQELKQSLLRRFCDVLYSNPVACDLFKLFRKEFVRIDAETNARLLHNSLLFLPKQPSEASLKRLGLALAEGSGIDESFNQCLSDVLVPVPAGLRNISFTRSLKALRILVGHVLATNATWQLPPPKYDAVHAALCRAANIHKHQNPHQLDVLGRRFHIDTESFTSFPALFHVWTYMTSCVRGQQDKANQAYRMFLDSLPADRK